jgi:hypothetical protein
VILRLFVDIHTQRKDTAICSVSTRLFSSPWPFYACICSVAAPHAIQVECTQSSNLCFELQLLCKQECKQADRSASAGILLVKLSPAATDDCDDCYCNGCTTGYKAAVNASGVVHLTPLSTATYPKPHRRLDYHTTTIASCKELNASGLLKGRPRSILC